MQEGLDEYVDVLFTCLCRGRGGRSILPFGSLLRCTFVSKAWRQRMLKSLPLLPYIAFPSGVREHLTGNNVLHALAFVAGKDLRAVDLRQCCAISANGMEQILGLIQQRCPGVTEIDTTGCREQAILRALSTCAKAHFRATSPAALHERFKSLQKGARCSYAGLQSLLLEDGLLFDPCFTPGVDALYEAIAQGSAWDVVLLLSTTYGQEGTCIFDCDVRNKNGRCAVHVAAEQGEKEILEILATDGADIDAKDGQGNTPLLLACMAGHMDLAKMLIAKGANINAQNEAGNTPLLTACRAGYLEDALAKMLVEAGADVEALRMASHSR
jgi:hypothetical protein